jgi:hypothetical protein
MITKVPSIAARISGMRSTSRMPRCSSLTRLSVGR